MSDASFDELDEIIFPEDQKQASEPSQNFVEEEVELNPTASQSLLSIDVGTVNTRAMLFDTVEGRYRYLAGGTSPTTAGAPMFDASEGVRNAMDTLERISGRVLTNQGAELLIPSTANGQGSDHLAATLSAARPLKVAVAGLLKEVSLASAENLVGTTYSNIVASMSISERNLETQINAIIKTRPDVIVIAGGANDGASRSVLRMVNALAMAVSLMDERGRPDVLFAGNNVLADQVKDFVEQYTFVHIAPNIRPALRTEQLGPAQARLADIFRQRHSAAIKGVDELNRWSNGNLQPTASSFGRVMRFLSQVVPSENRGVLGIDIGASHTTVAAGFDGDLRLRVLSDLGSGAGLSTILAKRQLNEIARWIPIEVSGEYVLNYIQNKIIYPRTLPATREDMAIEQALAREIMRLAIEETQRTFPRNAQRISSHMPMFNPIFVRGATVADAPTMGQALLMLLDGLEPTGVQQVIVDKNHITPALGSAAAVNPLLVSQLLFDPVAFANLGYVVAPVVNARAGTPVLRVRIKYDTGNENTVTFQAGTIQLIPLPVGRRARLFIDPLQRGDVGNGPGRSLTLDSITGGPFGVVVDARGRPLTLPKDNSERLRLLQSWHIAIGR
jgi:uncharacterized protein (TIGR01319 family)